MNYLLNGTDENITLDIVNDTKFIKCGKLSPSNSLQLGSLDSNGITESEFTFSIWIKPISQNSSLTFLGESGWNLDQDGCLYLSGDAEKIQVEASTWQQVTWVRTDQYQRLYLNATLVASIEGKQIPLDHTMGIDISAISGECLVARLHSYPRVLSQQDIIADYAASKGAAVASFTEQFPLDVNIVNDQEGELSGYPDNKLFILDVAGKDVTQQAISISNINNHSINLIALESTTVNSECFHFELRFRNATFSEPETYPLFEEKEGWLISDKAVQNYEDGSWSIYFLTLNNAVLEPNSEITFNFTYRTADGGMGARGTQMGFSYQNINFDSDSAIKGQRFKQVDILNLSSNNSYLTKLNEEITKSDSKVDALESDLLDLKDEIGEAKAQSELAQQAVVAANIKSEELNSMAQQLASQSLQAKADLVKEKEEAFAAKEQAEAANAAAEQANLSAQQAKEEAEQEKAEAVQAMEAARLATVAAEQENAEAQQAKQAAQLANAAAEQARQAAELATEAAAQEGANAGKAKEAAILANQQAEEAKEAAIAANNLAKQEKAEAVAAKLAAAQANTAAEQERMEAEAAKADSVLARNAANAAKAAAEQAKTAAAAEKKQAIQAKATATRMSNEAKAAKIAAEKAKSDVVKAKQQADVAQNNEIDLLTKAQEALRKNVEALDTEVDKRANGLDTRLETLEAMYPFSLSYDAPYGLICGQTGTLILYLHNRSHQTATLTSKTQIKVYIPFGNTAQSFSKDDKGSGSIKEIIVSPNQKQSRFSKLSSSSNTSVFQWKPSRTIHVPSGEFIELEFSNVVPNQYVGSSFIDVEILGLNGQQNNIISLAITKENRDIATRSGNGNIGIGTSTPNSKLEVNGHIRADRLYDRNNTGYYVDPASTSVLNNVKANRYYDKGNTSYYVDPASTSILNDVRAHRYYDQGNTSYYMDPGSTSYVNDLTARGYFRGNGRYITSLNASNISSGTISRYRLPRIELSWGSVRTTGYINSWDNAMNYSLGAGYVMVGLESYHSNHREDRRWKIKYRSLSVVVR